MTCFKSRFIYLLLAVQFFSTFHLEAQLPEQPETTDFKRSLDQQLDAMSVFGFRLASLGGDTSALSRNERWQHTFRELDRLNEQPPGTCAQLLPKLAEFLLVDAEKHPQVIVASAHLINQSVDKAEKLALKTGSQTSDTLLKYHCLLIAVTCAVERGDIKTALARLEMLEENTSAETDLGKWASGQTLAARFYEISGKPDRQIDTFRNLLKEYQRQLGSNHGNTLLWHNLLANALYKHGKAEEAEKQFSSLLEILRAKYGPDAEQTKVIAKSLSLCQNPPSLTKSTPAGKAGNENAEERKEMLRREQEGIDHFQAGRFIEAAREFQVVAANKIQRDGPESLGAMTTQNNLGAVLHELGQHEEAVTMLKEVLRIREEKFPEDKISQMEVRNNLGNALRGQGKHQESVEQHRMVATTREKLLGPYNIKTIDAWNNLAGGLADIGELKEAEEVAAKTVALRLKVQGPEHPTTLTSRQVLAIMLTRNGKRNAARIEHEDILAIAEKKLGAEHIETVKARKNLGDFLSQQGDFQESLKHLEKAHATSLKMLGEDNRLTQECSTVIMKVLMQINKSANPRFDKTRKELRASEKKLGAEHKQTLDLRLQLSKLLLQGSQIEDAETEFQKLITSLKKQDALGKQTGLEARSGMAEIQRLKGNLQAAETAHQEIFKETTALLGEQHALALESKSRVAATLSDLGRDLEAMNLLHEVLAARRKTMGTEAEPVFTTYYQMATCMLKMKRLMEGRSFASQAAAGYEKIKGPHDALTQKAQSLVAEIDLAGFRPSDLRTAPFKSGILNLDSPPIHNPFAIPAPTTLSPVDANAPGSNSRYFR